MECGILLIFPLIHLLLVRAADVNDVDTQVKAGNVEALNECYWSGEGPICDGKCRAGETVASESKKNDGHGCIIGKKMYCCKGGLSSNTTELAAAAAPHHVKRQHENQVTNSSAGGGGGQLPLGDTKDDCYWVGKSPNCKGSCLEGDYMVNTSRTANGSTCIVGKKKYCCKGSGTNNTLNNGVPAHSNNSTTEPPPTNTVHKQMMNGNSSSSCYWVGKAPICLGSCKLGDYVAEKSPTGDGGEKCESGQKKFCCARQQSTAPVSSTTQEPPRQPTSTAIGQQMDKVVNNSISNSTIGPFQARRRPTPRGLPINSTVTNRVKIVKIKRKLVMSTPTAENASTSISMSETSSTLAMASLLTLPSTTESAATTTASTTTATATTESTTTVTTESTTAATTTSESTTTPIESTTTTTATATPIPTTLATRSTSAATESTSVATAWPSTPAASSTSMKPTTSSAPKKFTPFFNLPDVLPVPLIFRIQKSANAEISATPSIIQSSTTSVATTTPTTLE